MAAPSSEEVKISTLMKVTQGLVDLLAPLTSEDRKRALQAAFALLGSGEDIAHASIKTPGDDVSTPITAAVPAKAKLWMKQNGVTAQALEQVFLIEEGTANFIAGEIPGKSGKEKSLNAYVLCGLAAFLSTGETKFTDQQARKLCMDSGCYDANNHGTYLKAKGSNFTGSKDAGWTLTSPGLKTVAKIVLDLAAPAS